MHMAQTVVLAVTDPNILYLLRRYVEESGMIAVVAGRDGNLAEAVARSRPALVIAEAGDGPAGRAALRDLRDHPGTRATPVLLYGSEGRLAAAEDAGAGPDGATGYLQEYVMYDQFLAALGRVGVRPPAARQAALT